LKCIVVAAALLGGTASPSVAQSSARDKLAADAGLRIKALNDRFKQIGDAA